MAEQIDIQELAAMRLKNSGVTNPFESIEACTESLFGIQAQVQQFAEISVLNRVESIDRQSLNELYDNHRLIKMWGQRMTVHMYTAEDWKYINRIFADRNNFVRRAWEGKEEVLEKILSELDLTALGKGRLSKTDIEKIILSHVPNITDQFVYYSIILKATLNGRIFGVPELPHTSRYGHITLCSSGVNDLQTAEAMQNLLLRYFKAYGPASLSDFLHWSGLTKKEVQPDFENIKHKLTEYSSDGKSYYGADQCGTVASDESFMLGKFDPLLVCYSDKTWIADAVQQKSIWQSAARVEAVVISGTELMGTWRHVTKGKNIEFNIVPLKKFSAKQKRNTQDKAAKIAEFMNKKLTAVNFI